MAVPIALAFACGVTRIHSCALAFEANDFVADDSRLDQNLDRHFIIDAGKEIIDDLAGLVCGGEAKKCFDIGVRKQGALDVWPCRFEGSEILVCQVQTNAALADFAQQCGDITGEIILALVDIDKKRDFVGAFGRQGEEIPE